MTDPTQAGQPSEEELRAYLEQLRTADPAEVLVQAYRMLGTGAEVKLGRPDARLLIDAMHGLVEAVDGRLAAELVQQMRDGVRQLQMAQVQVENEAAGQDAPAGADRPAGAGAAQQGAAGGARPGSGQGQPPPGQGQPPPGRGGQGAPGPDRPGGGQSMTDRLWIPGRDPNPR